MQMVFRLPDIIGMERKDQSDFLQPMERAQVIRDIVVHLRKKNIIGKKGNAPVVHFHGTAISVICDSYFMAEQLLREPPLHKGFPFEVVSKAFGAAKAEAHICRWMHFALSLSDETLKDIFAEYTQKISELLDTENMIALAQYYSFNNGIEDERVFSGTFVFFAGRLKSGQLPQCCGRTPEKVIYRNMESK